LQEIFKSERKQKQERINEILKELEQIHGKLKQAVLPGTKLKLKKQFQEKYENYATAHNNFMTTARAHSVHSKSSENVQKLINELINESLNKRIKLNERVRSESFLKK